MRRREFLSVMSGGAMAWPFAALAQQPRRPTIGFLGTAAASAWSQWVAAFVDRLRELGWIEERTVTIEYRWGEGRHERLAEIAAELVRLKVDVIVTSGTAVPDAMRATSTIPIVFALAADPVGAGLVATLARPGGNVTGLSIQSADLVGKRIELLREVVPNFHRLAILGNGNNQNLMLDVRDAQSAAKALRLQEVAIFEIRRAEDISPAIEKIKNGADALYVVADPLVNANRVHLNALALRARLPTMHGSREYVVAGGLICYGPNFSGNFRRAADFADKILRGANPAELPVEQPVKFDLVINLATAKTLGLSVPGSFLVRADEIIE
ncbi:MAG: ABC transporter substrate-binding protein [Pseudorhodoplanes sp.]|uniref:ABC transporter substrate-binding protein n=1 Tax=Pseudorhodoplanes sp. TaxID=1934341 RepID=UPI003D11E3CF